MRNVPPCCCCTSVGFGYQGPCANAGSDSHSALPACKGPRVPLSPCLSLLPVVQQEPWSLGAPLLQVLFQQVSVGAAVCSTGSLELQLLGAKANTRHRWKQKHTCLGAGCSRVLSVGQTLISFCASTQWAAVLELPGGCTVMPEVMSVPALVASSKAQSCAAANHLMVPQHALTQAVCYQGSLLIRAMPEPAQPPAGVTGRLPTNTGRLQSPALGPHCFLPGSCSPVSSADKTGICCFKQEGSRAKGWCADPMTRGAGGSCPALLPAKPRARSVLSGFVPAQSRS